MSLVYPSRSIRQELDLLFAAGFNAALAQACLDCDIPGLAYEINFEDRIEETRSFFRGDRGVEELLAHDEPHFPAMCTWLDAGQDLNQQKPRKFSGVVAGHWRVILFERSVRPLHLVDLREATEAVMVELLDSAVQVLYRKDLSWEALAEQQWIDLDGQTVGWIQPVTFHASFEAHL